MYPQRFFILFLWSIFTRTTNVSSKFLVKEGLGVSLTTHRTLTRLILKKSRAFFHEYLNNLLDNLFFFSLPEFYFCLTADRRRTVLHSCRRGQVNTYLGTLNWNFCFNPNLSPKKMRENTGMNYLMFLKEKLKGTMFAIIVHTVSDYKKRSYKTWC